MATHLIFVDATPVTVTANAPLVVSAETATAHPVGTLSSLITELTKTVVPALASRRIIPLTYQAPTSVPSDAFSLATTVPENV